MKVVLIYINALILKCYGCYSNNNSNNTTITDFNIYGKYHHFEKLYQTILESSIKEDIRTQISSQRKRLKWEIKVFNYWLDAQRLQSFVCTNEGSVKSVFSLNRNSFEIKVDEDRVEYICFLHNAKRENHKCQQTHTNTITEPSCLPSAIIITA